MIKQRLMSFFTLLFSVWAFSAEIKSPDNKLQLLFDLKEGVPYYWLKYDNNQVIGWSKMGFRLKPHIDFQSDFEIVDIQYSQSDTQWKPVLGQYKIIRDHHTEMLVSLKQKHTQWLLNIRFRLFNDGLGFRYEFPVQKDLFHFEVEQELTEFQLTGDHKAFWLPADYDTNEYPTTISLLSQVEALKDEVLKEPLAAKSPAKQLAVQTPLMLKTSEGLYINIHEAALVNYPAMCLNLDAEKHLMSTHLTPNKNGDRGFIQTGTVSPWRTIIVSDDARAILASSLILNLNEPCKIADTSWIKPIKYVGVWWEYFTGGGSTWAYSDSKDIVIGQTDYKKLIPNGRHGANTQHVKEYIDFAAEHGFDAVLVEGWNEGWEDNYAYVKEKIYDFTKPYPDFDVEEIQRYAKQKGVKICMHHETTSSVIDYEKQLPAAFEFMKKHGYNIVKTGYVGRIIPRSEHHDSQWMVNHYLDVVKKAADYKIMVNSHEAVRPTGLSRTYPNWIAQESARGTEFESFNGNHPNHTTILPFTRFMGGPMDYTPGIFQADLSVYGNNKAKLSSTLAKQLALYVVLYSPLQMAADLYTNYQKHLDAFQFIKDVALDWDDTYILEAEPGEFITIARKAKGKNRWFVGAITNENSRSATVDLSFLPKGKTYKVVIYADAKQAHWKNNPMAYKIEKKTVKSSQKLKIPLAAGGGAAISIFQID